MNMPAIENAASPALKAAPACCHFHTLQKTSSHPRMTRLPEGYFRIDSDRRDQLTGTKFNPPPNGFDEAFSEELNAFWKEIFNHFSRLGEYGSDERFDKKLPSDWWISDDGYWDSRGLGVDILNPEFQAYGAIEGVRDFLRNLPDAWAVFLYHDNAFDSKGSYVQRWGVFHLDHS
ncbi:MAG: hypothetical protein EOP84_24660 [Verrucomicrobiaceae bacterium]|nr:MAG: hypothetical protein EOP84_24660 [Verrucomicrobiaceae bacterium]